MANFGKKIVDTYGFNSNSEFGSAQDVNHLKMEITGVSKDHFEKLESSPDSGIVIILFKD